MRTDFSKIYSPNELPVCRGVLESLAGAVEKQRKSLADELRLHIPMVPCLSSSRRERVKQKEQLNREKEAREKCNCLTQALQFLLEKSKALLSALSSDDDVLQSAVSYCRQALENLQAKASPLRSADSNTIRSMLLRHCSMLFCTVNSAAS